MRFFLLSGVLLPVLAGAMIVNSNPAAAATADFKSAFEQMAKADKAVAGDCFIKGEDGNFQFNISLACTRSLPEHDRMLKVIFNLLGLNDDGTVIKLQAVIEYKSLYALIKHLENDPSATQIVLTRKLDKKTIDLDNLKDHVGDRLDTYPIGKKAAKFFRDYATEVVKKGRAAARSKS